MTGSSVALPRANSALAKSQIIASSLASNAAGADGASHVASNDGAGGTLWTSVAGFLSALLGGNVAGSAPTRAQMVANSVPAAVTTITTSGYATPGDFGGATFVRAAGPFSDGASFQSADGQWWQYSAAQPAPAHFGAFGGANPASVLPDDTTALQNLINYAKAHGCAIYFPARTYRHTLSLNWGKANPDDGTNLKVFGSAIGYSRIVSDLSESRPAHDFTNQKFGEMANFYLTSTTGSKHTCLMLFAETQGAGMNQFTASTLNINDFGTSSNYAVFGLSADQFLFDKSSVSTWNPAALAAVFFSNKNPAAIASKFYTIAASDADVTLFQANFGAFEGFQCPALWVQGFNGVNMFSTYAGTTNNGQSTGVGHAKGMIRFGSGTNNADGSIRIGSLALIGCRTEDNNVAGTTPLASVTGSIAPGTDNATSVLTVTATASGAIAVGMLLTGTNVAAGTVVLAPLTATTWQVTQVQTVAATTIAAYLYSSPAIYIEDAVYESIIQGAFGTNGAGVLGGPGKHANSQVSAGIDYGAFHNAGALIGGRFHFSGGSNYGGSFDQANSRGYALGGRVGTSEAAVLAAYGPTMNELSDLDYDYNLGFSRRLRADTRVFFGSGNTGSPTNYGLGWRGASGPFNLNAYTGGSGLQIVSSYPQFNPACLYYDGVSSTELSTNYATFTQHGQFASNWAAGGEMRFTIQQTVNGTFMYQTLIDLTNLPAYGAVTAYKLTLSMYAIGNDSSLGWYCTVLFETYGSAPVSASNFLNLAADGFNAQSGAVTAVNMLISNSASNPLVPGTFFKLAAA